MTAFVRPLHLHFDVEWKKGLNMSNHALKKAMKMTALARSIPLHFDDEWRER
jgi:hypothetical protein